MWGTTGQGMSKKALRPGRRPRHSPPSRRSQAFRGTTGGTTGAAGGAKLLPTFQRDMPRIATITLRQGTQSVTLERKGETWSLKDRGGYPVQGERVRALLVKLADVQWIESSGNYVHLHAGKDVHEVRETLTSIESRLDPRQFVRIHRRTIVSVDAM